MSGLARQHGPQCRVCGTPSTEPAFEIGGVPRWNHRLLREDEVPADKPTDLCVYQCPTCGFVCTAVNLGDDYYDDYLNVPSLSPQAQGFQDEQARLLVERFSLKGKKVLEVGCGDGYFLGALTAAGAEAFGIEPSESQRRLALARGCRVEGGVLSRGRVLADAPFDAFANRQVLEHVDDIRNFLMAIRENVRPGAVGMVEVPNLDKLAEGGRFFDFIPEHVNYFSPRTLRLALELAGFHVESVDEVDGGESLRALVRWMPAPAYELPMVRLRSLREDVSRFVAKYKQSSLKVAIWGAGGKGLSMMAVCDLAGIELLVDSNPGKVGLYTPVSHLRVESPAELSARGIGAVIVMAPAFEREIARRLRGDLGFRGVIALAGAHFVEVE